VFILKILYNLFIALIVPVAVPVGYLIALKKKEDEDFFERFGFITFPESPDGSIWFHCASVGEVRSLKSVIEFIKQEFPDLKIMISTTTATGKKMANAELEPYFSFLLPIENTLTIGHIIDYMNVKAVFIVDTELWPNMISVASARSKLFLINGRISDKTFRSYQKFGFIFSRLLKKFDTIFTKSAEDTLKFSDIKGNSGNIVTLGNIKFQSRSEMINSGIFNYLRNHSVFAAASTHSGEEDTIFKAFQMNSKCDRMVIAPRHLNRVDSVAAKAREFGFTVSKLADRDSSTEVVIVDRFGTLEELYQMADKIFIGGSLDDTGGHNSFEALQFEKDVCVGPNMKNFTELNALSEKFGITTTINNEKELSQYINQDKRELDFTMFFNELNSNKKQKLNSLKEVLQSVSSD